ncbi:GNAT family N-acetyltransferase [Microbacterium esteraromaticum]|uniref:GNAT family N-acetyltransferase n=1 Tax=Microbacterium esteraromaticum TaxID=57043 RepID=A0A7D8AJG0_9MICO|nr:GNAT family protein [Microbacterium esteraromaticum]QMU96969.1 GNAT family N-acetyltransferase [Microbacterium esteraromaticum]
MSSLSDVAWPLRTERLEIRPCTIDDLDAVWAFRRLPEVNRWLGRAPATREAFGETYSDPARLAMTLVIVHPDADDGRPAIIGDLMVKQGDGWAQAEVAEQAAGTEAELGWVLAPAFAGRGLAAEAVGAVIDLCFGSLGLRRVHAGCFAANEPSWRLMERLGMRREEYSRGTALHRSGEWMDGMNYGLLAEEWSGRR